MKKKIILFTLLLCSYQIGYTNLDNENSLGQNLNIENFEQKESSLFLGLKNNILNDINSLELNLNDIKNDYTDKANKYPGKFYKTISRDYKNQLKSATNAISKATKDLNLTEGLVGNVYDTKSLVIAKKQYSIANNSVKDARKEVNKIKYVNDNVKFGGGGGLVNSISGEKKELTEADLDKQIKDAEGNLNALTEEQNNGDNDGFEEIELGYEIENELQKIENLKKDKERIIEKKENNEKSSKNNSDNGGNNENTGGEEKIVTSNEEGINKAYESNNSTTSEKSKEKPVSQENKDAITGAQKGVNKAKEGLKAAKTDLAKTQKEASEVTNLDKQIGSITDEIDKIKKDLKDPKVESALKGDLAKKLQTLNKSKTKVEGNKTKALEDKKVLGAYNSLLDKELEVFDAEQEVQDGKDLYNKSLANGTLKQQKEAAGYEYKKSKKEFNDGGYGKTIAEYEEVKNNGGVLSAEQEVAYAIAKNEEAKVAVAEEEMNDAQDNYDTNSSEAKNDISSRGFVIQVNNISPGKDVQGENTSENVNYALGTIIQILMIMLGSFALLVMTIGAGFIILHHGQDELLSKGKSIFMSGVFALVVALASYYIVSIFRFILFN